MNLEFKLFANGKKGNEMLKVKKVSTEGVPAKSEFPLSEQSESAKRSTELSSGVFRFRLNPKNERDNTVIQLIKTFESDGIGLRQLVVESILQFANAQVEVVPFSGRNVRLSADELRSLLSETLRATFEEFYQIGSGRDSVSLDDFLGQDLNSD